MPPRSSAVSSTSNAADAHNEVVCPLKNQDGSSCRKRCTGEKRYRSMQEHIRRAHPDHYIMKLPATEESFQQMINKDPTKEPLPLPQISNSTPSVVPNAYPIDRPSFYAIDSRPISPRMHDPFPDGEMTGLQHPQHMSNSQPPTEWASDIQWLSDNDGPGPNLNKNNLMRSSVELPPLQQGRAPTSEPFSSFQHSSMNSSRPRDSYPPLLHNSSPGRSSTLPPIQRLGPARSSPHKQSLTKLAGSSSHKRKLSKEQPHIRRMSQDRKAYSVEPTSNPVQSQGYGSSRWEDLIEAATSATEDGNEDRTPMPESPRPMRTMNRGSQPPFSALHFQDFTTKASPLQRTLTPPIYGSEIPNPFPSVEGLEHPDQYHGIPPDFNDSSHHYTARNVQLICAACRNPSLLNDSYACTECICGICQTCASAYQAGASLGGQRNKCPRCGMANTNFRKFQIDLR